MVRGLEVEAHQAEQRVQEPLGLAERQAEDDPQRQRGPDREVRVPPLASAKTVLRWYPRGNCILAQPDRDVAAAPEATLVLPPVPDSVLLLVLAVDSARLRCDHDVTPPISMMDWTLPPPLACSLTPIHAPTPALRYSQSGRARGFSTKFPHLAPCRWKGLLDSRIQKTRDSLEEDLKNNRDAHQRVLVQYFERSVGHGQTCSGCVF